MTQHTNSERKAAIVTGGSRGIGAAISRRLAREGYSVIINYASKAAEAEALVAELRAAGAAARAVQADMAQAGGAARLFDAAMEEFGGVDLLVNNAGILATAPIADFADADFHRVFMVNVLGVFTALREAAARMCAGGRIVNISSTLVTLDLPGYGAYSATKAAVEAFTRVLAKELRGRNITVNAVAPGPIATELFLDGKTEEEIRHFSQMPPLERLGMPDDIAGVVAFLASPDGGWINGQSLRDNGGLV